ncbi:lysophospholipid acyltransferase family protein [Candidatus Poriferisodalis sp.]|uniref:lysophospholipid acyltransferase family protein n=1 Tax=Candidatus Poriferisodalis sp. TaxID=3101277 RepID=UPI003B0184BF
MSDPNRRTAVPHFGAKGSGKGSGRKKASVTRIARNAEFPLRAGTTPKGQIPLPANVGSNYETDWARRFPARVARRVARDTLGRAIVRYYARPTIKGVDRLSDLRGPAVFAANHQSHADTAVMVTSIPEPWCNRLVVGAAADYFFGNRFSSAISALFVGAIPIERTSVNRRNIDQAVALLRSGWSLVIYPEGGRSRDGWGQQFRPGAAYLAKQAGVPVVPVHIRGTFDILRKGRAWPKRARAVVNFGRPLDFADDDNNRRFTRRLQAAVEGLADETATGNWFAARRRLHSADSPGLEGPAASAWRRRWTLTEPVPKSGEASPGDAAASKRRWPYV